MKAALLALALGGMAMVTAEADAGQNVVDDGPQAPFNQRVTIQGKGNPLKEIDAYQYVSKKDKKDCFGIRAAGKNGKPGGQLNLGMEIIDKDGVSWVVVRTIGNSSVVDESGRFSVYHVEVKKKD